MNVSRILCKKEYQSYSVKLLFLKMKYTKYILIILRTSALSFVLCIETEEGEEGSGVCEVLEGSTCDDENYCCKQSICNKEEPGMKCCNETLLLQRPTPADCSMCPMCKDIPGSEGNGSNSSRAGKIAAIVICVLCLIALIALIAINILYFFTHYINRDDDNSAKEIINNKGDCMEKCRMYIRVTNLSSHILCYTV